MELAHGTDPNRFKDPFTSLGLTPAPVSLKAGELLIFNTALFHSQHP